MLALAVIGPGIIVGNADNDPSGIYGYSVAGASYGYGMLWMLALIIISLYVIQEMCARMAIATGKGLADLIREEFGIKIALLAMVTLFIANFSTTISEFAGISAAVGLLFKPGIHRFLMPLLTFVIWIIVMRGSYRGVERILLAASFIYLSYVVTAVMAHPNWQEVSRSFVTPHVKMSSDYMRVAISLIGTTITPWGLFFIQSSIRDKGISARHYRYVRMDIIAGSIFVGFIAACILIACAATLHPKGIYLGMNANAADAAKALAPFVGRWASTLFAIGVLNAGMFGAIVVPLSTAYAITESLGWESGLGRRIREAPLFAGVYGVLIFLSALVVIVSNPDNLGFLIQLPNIVGCILLPIILVLALKLVNNKEIMGNYVNTRWANIITWSTAIVIITLSIALAVLTFI